MDDDEYTLHETDDLTGTTDTTATAVPKSYTGFTENTSHPSRVASGTITGDGTLVLKLYYTRDTYTVSFDSQGGDEVDSIENVKHGAKIAEPEKPTNGDLRFDGWHTQPTCTIPWYFTSNTVTGNTTLYAKWTATTAVTLDPNGGDGFAEQTDVYAEGQKINLQNKAFAGNKEGFEATGWNTANDGTGTHYDFGAVYTVPVDDVTLYVEWTQTYDLTYNPNGGDGFAEYSHKYTAGSIISLPNKDITGHKEGFEATGWNTANDGTGTHYDFSAQYTTTASDVTLYVEWTVVYGLTFDPNGGDGFVLYTEEYTAGSQVNLENNEYVGDREGYVPAGWNTKADGSGTHYNFGGVYTTTAADATLYVEWDKLYGITFDPNGGDGFEEMTEYHTEGTSFPLPARILVGNKEGYVPTGWNTKADGSGTHYDFEENFETPANDVRLYAEWSTSYTITYNLCGGTSDGGNPDSYISLETPIALNDAVREGYEFYGWYDNESYSGDIVENIPEGAEGNKEYWARWTSTATANGKLMITFYRADTTKAILYVYNGESTDAGISKRYKYNESETLTEMTAFNAEGNRETMTRYHSNGKAQYKYFYDTTTNKKKSMMSYGENGVQIAKTEYYENGLSAKRQYIYYASGNKKAIKNFRANKNMFSQKWFYSNGKNQRQFNTYDVNGKLTSVSKYYMNGQRYYYKKY